MKTLTKRRLRIGLRAVNLGACGWLLHRDGLRNGWPYLAFGVLCIAYLTLEMWKRQEDDDAWSIAKQRWRTP